MRLEEVSTNEERVNEVNREMSSQMAALVKELDDDKRMSLEKYVQQHF